MKPWRAAEMRPDGDDYYLQIDGPAGLVEIPIPRGFAIEIVKHVQANETRKATEGKGSVRLPVLQVLDLYLGHDPQTTELTVSTNEIGRVVLAIPATKLPKLEEVVRLLSLHRSGPKSTN